MSFILLIILLGVGLVHGLKVRKRTNTALAELLLVYVLVGYCGLYMFSAGILDLVASFRQETIFPFPAGGPVQQFFDFAFLGMATIALLSIWFRGPSLVAPTLGWSIFWFGATYIHLTELYTTGGFTFGAFWGIFSSHTIVALVMLFLLFVVYHSRSSEVCKKHLP